MQQVRRPAGRGRAAPKPVPPRPWLRTHARSARSRYARRPPRVWRRWRRRWRPRRRRAAAPPRARSPPASPAAAPSATAASSSSSSSTGRPEPGTAPSRDSPRPRRLHRSAGRPRPAAGRPLDNTPSRDAPTPSSTSPGLPTNQKRRSPTRTPTDSALSTSRRKEVSASAVRSPPTIFESFRFSTGSIENLAGVRAGAR